MKSHAEISDAHAILRGIARGDLPSNLNEEGIKNVRMLESSLAWVLDRHDGEMFAKVIFHMESELHRMDCR